MVLDLWAEPLHRRLSLESPLALVSSNRRMYRFRVRAFNRSAVT